LKLPLILIFILSCLGSLSDYRVDENLFSTHQVDPTKGKLKLYWKNDDGEIFGSFKNLKDGIESKGQKLVFAVNAGMYQKDQSPQGLFIENGVEKHKINRVENAYGNFYLQPNGVFYWDKHGKAYIDKTSDFKSEPDILYATQSGPMLLIDGEYHPALKKGSTNMHIRNGVGILPNGNVLFAISNQKVNFYDFATLFKQLGCKNALYLDGFVSKCYLPANGANDLGGAFGVIIGEIE
jgi:uncharacterized protein YigE (DUF2233 family)